jgi:hypothetical protein
MGASGGITIVRHPDTKMKTSYSTSKSNSDNRVTINGWKAFMQKENTLKIGDKMLFMLYVGITSEPYLFVSHIPDVALN